MIIDATHRRWIAATAGLSLLAALAYVAAARAIPGGVTGGSAAGLVFGVGAAVLMAFEGLLAFRKRRRAWRLGRASAWMRGHVWLGLLAVPLVLFHSGFRAGGAVTACLLVLFGLVTVSGIYGLMLQQFLPRLMTGRVEMETIYEQIPQVVAQIRAEAADRVEKAGQEALSRFFREEMDPYLTSDGGSRHRLGDPGRAEAVFKQLRAMLPAEHQETVADLAGICEERRQLAVQNRLHRWLHGWLLVHAPLSYGLLLLVAAHAVMTLLY